uniref:Endonuclease/exonuclease/phosphatase domain-containing protein n=1 Tax=Mastacembelus armatus TaxID=205130 RepID=A0A7N8XGL2_9TELE
MRKLWRSCKGGGYRWCRQSKGECVGGVECIHRGEEGRVLVVDVVCDGQRIRLISIHAPNDVSARRDFFMSLEKWCTQATIIMGDWNVVMDRRDAGVNNKYGNDVSRKAVWNLMSVGKLVDVWRTLHPNMTAFSRRQVILGKMKQGCPLSPLLYA